MGVVVTILLVLGALFIGFPLLVYIFNKLIVNYKKKKIREKDKAIREYFKNFDEDNELEILDETPRPIFIGDRFYMISPLKYRQFTRICVLFAKVIQSLSEQGITVENVNDNFGKVIEKQEDEFFKALAYVLYFSNNTYEDNERKIMAGVLDEFNNLKDKANITEVSRLVEIVIMQNDIARALKAFGNFGKKKVLAGR